MARLSLGFQGGDPAWIGMSGTWLGSLLFFFFPVLGLELRAYTLHHSTSHIFCEGFFEIGSLELFAQAGFKL
jgi:hypothetical protein